MGESLHEVDVLTKKGRQEKVKDLRSHEKWPVNGTTVDTVACWGRMSAERASQLAERAVAGCCSLRLGLCGDREAGNPD